MRRNLDSKLLLLNGLIIVLLSPLFLPRSIALYPFVFAIPVLVWLIAAIAHQGIDRVNGMLILVLFSSSLTIALITESLLINVLLSIATYSALLLLPLRLHASAQDKATLITLFHQLIIAATVFNGAIGLYQLIAEGFPFRLPYRDFSPDTFQGLFGTGGNRLAAILFTYAALWTTAKIHLRDWHKQKQLYAYILLIILPGSNVAIISAIVGMCVNAAMHLHKDRQEFRKTEHHKPVNILLISAVGLTLFLALHASGNITYMKKAIEESQQTPAGFKTARMEALNATIFELPKHAPYQPAIGIGLGNYSSWSQMLLSGHYVDQFILGQHANNLTIPVSRRDITEDLVLRHISPMYFQIFGKWYVNSIVTQPFWTWQSLYAETGILGIVLIILCVRRHLKSTVRGQERNALLQAHSYFCISATFTFLLLCLADNYLEYPWASYPLIAALLLHSCIPTKKIQQ